MATSQAIWFKHIFEDMDKPQDDAMVMYCDNKSAIAMVKNPVFYNRIKHISIKFHFIREAEANKEIGLKYYKIEEQLVDLFTKILPKDKFKILWDMIGVTEIYIKKEWLNATHF